MLLALREIVSVDQDLPLQIGVNWGPVFVGEIGPRYRRTYTVMGDTVNLAARLMAKAAGPVRFLPPASCSRVRALSSRRRSSSRFWSKARSCPSRPSRWVIRPEAAVPPTSPLLWWAGPRTRGPRPAWESAAASRGQTGRAGRRTGDGEDPAAAGVPAAIGRLPHRPGGMPALSSGHSLLPVSGPSPPGPRPRGTRTRRRLIEKLADRVQEAAPGSDPLAGIDRGGDQRRDPAFSRGRPAR